MARIAYVSPLPPATTGIATYSAAVLASLRASGFGRRHVVEPVWPLGRAAEDAVRAADLAVYHVGNNVEFHGDIYRLAVRRPGLVVLHDLALDDLVRAFVAARDPLGHRAEAEAEPARQRLVRTWPDLREPLEVPSCAHLVRRSRGVVVHSPFGARYVDAFGARTPSFVVPHPVLDPPRAARRAWRRARRLRRALPGRFVIGALGDVGAAKAIDAVLGALALLPEEAHLAIVGRSIPGYDAREAVAASGLSDRVTVALDVADRDFYAWLEVSDVVVNLRHPHRGEVSGTLLRAMAAGKAVVVQAEGTYLDWPDDAVVRVPGGPPDPAELARALERLLRDDALRTLTAAGAREVVARQRREGRTAAGYADAIEATLSLMSDPVRFAASRWATALAATGAREPDAALATGYVDAALELATADVPGVRWAAQG